MIETEIYIAIFAALLFGLGAYMGYLFGKLVGSVNQCEEDYRLLGGEQQHD